MGQSHFKTIKESKISSIYGIVDPNIKDSISKDTKIFKSLEDVDFKNLAFDCAIIASSTKSHFELTNNLMSFNIPVLVEKPLTDDIDELYNLLLLQRKSNSILRVGFIELYNPVVYYLENIKKNEVVKIEISRLSQPSLAKRGLSDVLYDIAIHDVSILAKYFGLEQNKIIEKKFRKKNNIIDYAKIEFDLGDININLTASSRESKKQRIWKLYTTKHLHKIDFLNYKVEILDITTNKVLKNFKFNSSSTNLYNQLENFIDKINKKDVDISHLKIIEQSHKFIENLY